MRSSRMEKTIHYENPQFILDEIAQYVKEGDITSIQKQNASIFVVSMVILLGLFAYIYRANKKEAKRLFELAGTL